MKTNIMPIDENKLEEAWEKYLMTVRSDGCVAQERNIQKRIYKSFCVPADSNPVNTCKALNEKIDSLVKFGWTIERIDCHDNIFGIWKSDERKYYPTKDYIIVACEVNL